MSFAHKQRKTSTPTLFTANIQRNTGFLDFARIVSVVYRTLQYLGFCKRMAFIVFQCAPTAHLLATNTGGIASTWSS